MKQVYYVYTTQYFVSMYNDTITNNNNNDDDDDFELQEMNII